MHRDVTSARAFCPFLAFPKGLALDAPPLSFFVSNSIKVHMYVHTYVCMYNTNPQIEHVVSHLLFLPQIDSAGTRSLRVVLKPTDTYDLYGIKLLCIYVCQLISTPSNGVIAVFISNLLLISCFSVDATNENYPRQKMGEKVHTQERFQPPLSQRNGEGVVRQQKRMPQKVVQYNTCTCTIHPHRLEGLRYN